LTQILVAAGFPQKLLAARITRQIAKVATPAANVWWITSRAILVTARYGAAPQLASKAYAIARPGLAPLVTSTREDTEAAA